jgi:signal transduction histidine kinase
VKYSHAQVAVRSEVSAEGNEVVIRISDQGAGIPPQDLKHVFKRFFRTGSSRNKVKGTGLGLFIVRTLIHKHRGKVRADSEGEHSGTTITLRLPRFTT